MGGMKKLSDKSPTVKVLWVTIADLVSRVDEWRRHQPDNPNRSAAIRRLVEQALQAQPDTARRR